MLRSSEELVIPHGWNVGGTNPLRSFPKDAEPEMMQTEINNNGTMNDEEAEKHRCYMDRVYRYKSGTDDKPPSEECEEHEGCKNRSENRLSIPKKFPCIDDAEELIRRKLILNVNDEPRLKYQIGTLYDLMVELRKAFETDNVNIQYVHAIMAAYKSNPKEWERFAKFDKFRYTRNLVDAGNGKYNLMLLCWGEGHGSAIHDHADAHCFMKMLHGQLCETRFEWPEHEVDPDNLTEGDEAALKEKGRSMLLENQVCYINDSLGLHRVENVSNSERAVSLHLYCPPFDSCSVFNQRTGHRSKSKVTFWSIYGERRDKKSAMEDVEPEDN